MRKALGIIYIVSGILGLASLFLLSLFLLIYFSFINMLTDYQLLSFESINFFFTNLFNPGMLLVLFYIFVYGILILVSLLTSIASIILGALALGKKLSDNAVALGAIIYGALAGGLVFLIIGIVMMLNVNEEKKKTQNQMITTANV